MDRRARGAIPGAKPAPWRRSASTATIFRHLPIAKPEIALPEVALPEVAGPLPVLVQAGIRKTVPGTNPEVANPFPMTMP